MSDRRVYPEWLVTFRGGPEDGRREVMSTDIRVRLLDGPEGRALIYERTGAKHVTWVEEMTMVREGRPDVRHPAGAGTVHWGWL